LVYINGEEMKRRSFIQTLGATGFVSALPRMARAEGVQFNIHNKVGQNVLLESLNNPTFWDGVDVERPTDQLYDEFKLKKLDTGYLTFVSGHGNQNYTREQVTQTVLYSQNFLPTHMSGAKKMTYFAEGVDPTFGVPFTDMVFLGDMDFFYCEYFQRMYRYDLDNGVTICAFERATEAFTTPERWAKYKKTREETIEASDLRWPILNDIVPVTDVYGMYILAPDTKTSFQTRVTMTAKLRFGTGTGLLAQWGSEIPYLIRSGTLNGFNASVAISKGLKDGVYPLRK
jgi:hypothetical protein